MGKYVEPSMIKGEKIDYTTLVLMHLMRISGALTTPAIIDERGIITDYRPQTLFYCVRLLDSWLSIFVGNTDYDKKVKEGKYREIYLPNPTNVMGNSNIVNQLFKWHDLQVGLFTQLGIAPKVKDFDPIGMSPFSKQNEPEDDALPEPEAEEKENVSLPTADSE